MKKNIFPKGWNEARVREVLNYYENQNEKEQVAEIEEMFDRRDQTIMTIPRPLVPRVRKLIAEHAKKKRSKAAKATRAA